MRYFRGMPEAYRLRLLRWQLFATLTFQEDGRPEHVRKSMIWSWLRKLARAYRVYFPELLFCIRFEYGASGGVHGHYHVLIAGLPPEAITPAGCRHAEALWTQRGGGRSQVEVFNPSLDGVGYILKTSGIEDDVCFPTLSEAVYRVVRSLPM